MKDVRDIVSQILSAEGGLVESIEPDGLEVLAPPSLAESLGVPEFSRLGFGRDLPDGASRVHLESEWMERLESLMRHRGSFLSVSEGLPALRKSSADFPQLLREHVVFENATYRVESVESCPSRYLALTFHLTAISDEKREDLLTIALNETNRACADHIITPLFASVGKPSRQNKPALNSGALPSPLSVHEISRWITRMLPARIQAHLAPFLSGMERRMALDLNRLHVYHEDLRSEAIRRMADKLKKGGPHAPSEKRDFLRIESINREYHAKIEDLKRKYAMHVEVRHLQSIRVTMPVERASLKIMRRKGVRPYHLDWNPLSKQFDRLPCEGCGTIAKTHFVCDDRLHIVCPGCMGECASCHKAYCRACHRHRCPTCGNEGPAALSTTGAEDI